MAYLGEIISIGVAICWTIGSLWSEYSSKRLGASVMNVWRMGFSVLMYAAMCGIFLGRPWPVYAGGGTWGLLTLSGFIGFFLGDLCLLAGYVLIGARLCQLFQTLAPAFAAVFGWILLGQTLGWKSIIAMAITLIGIGITVLGHGSEKKVSFQVPVKGILLGVAAALGQGLGLVISGLALKRYMSELPVEALSKAAFIPFSANMIRCISGFLAALLLMIFTHRMKEVMAAPKDRKSMLALIIVVIFGPVVGVGFSLMALRYTAAGIASTLQALTPILLILPSHWMFGEKLTWRSLLGALVSVGGVSLFFLL